MIGFICPLVYILCSFGSPSWKLKFDPSFLRLRVSSGMPITTRLESTQLDNLVEELKKSEGFCILPSSALEMLLQDNKLLRSATHDLNTRVATAIERIAEAIENLNGHFEKNSTQQTNNNSELVQRLDSLIEWSFNQTVSTTSQWRRDASLKDCL